MKGNTLYLFAAMSMFAQYNKSTSSNFFAVDATAIPLCTLSHSRRSKIGLDSAKLGHSGKGFFYGYKLHGIIDMVSMRIVSFKITPANVSDIKALDNKMVAGLSGVLVGDKGYTSKQKKMSSSSNDFGC